MNKSDDIWGELSQIWTPRYKHIEIEESIEEEKQFEIEERLEKEEKYLNPAEYEDEQV